MAHGEPGVVGQRGAGADDDGAAPGPQVVDVGARRLAGDPAARAVGRGHPAVEGGGALGDDEGATGAPGVQPRGVEGLTRLLEEATLDGDARGSEGCGAARGQRVGVGHRVDDPADAGLDERPGARRCATGVVAGLEGDVGRAAAGPVPRLREGVDLRVGGARPAVVTRADDRAHGIRDDTADTGVGVGLGPEAGSVDRPQHQRGALVHVLPSCLEPVLRSGSGRKGVERSGHLRAPDHDDRRRDPTRAGFVGTCCLPSGLSPSVLEFHQVNRPLAAAGSRTVTAGSELHRPRSTCHVQYAAHPRGVTVAS